MNLEENKRARKNANFQDKKIRDDERELCMYVSIDVHASGYEVKKCRLFE